MNGIIPPLKGESFVHDTGIQSTSKPITPLQVLYSVHISAHTYTDEEFGADISFSQIAKKEVENVSHNDNNIVCNYNTMDSTKVATLEVKVTMILFRVSNA